MLYALISPLIAGAQMRDKAAGDVQEERKSAAVSISILPDKPIKETGDAEALNTIGGLPDDYPLNRFTGTFDSDYRVKSEYVASLDLLEFLKPGKAGAFDPVGTEVLFGLRRPYYRLGKDLRCAGVVDLRMSGSIGGCENSLTIAFGYDFRKEIGNGTFEAGVSLVKIGYLIKVPVSFDSKAAK